MFGLDDRRVQAMNIDDNDVIISAQDGRIVTGVADHNPTNGNLKLRQQPTCPGRAHIHYGHVAKEIPASTLSTHREKALLYTQLYLANVQVGGVAVFAGTVPHSGHRSGVAVGRSRNSRSSHLIADIWLAICGEE